MTPHYITTETSVTTRHHINNRPALHKDNHTHTLLSTATTTATSTTTTHHHQPTEEFMCSLDLLETATTHYPLTMMKPNLTDRIIVAGMLLIVRLLNQSLPGAKKNYFIY